MLFRSGNTERIEVAWCVQGGHGTRVIPDGAISGAHFVQTPDYVQVTGVGDLTKINIPKGDEGGELDPHGADGNGECDVLSALFGPGRARDLVFCDVAARLRVLLKLGSYLTTYRQPDRRAGLLERVRRAPADARMDGKRPHTPLASARAHFSRRVQNFVAFDEFCIRACKDGPNAPQLCQHVYDVLGCEWNMPGDYSAGAFDQCLGDTGEVRAPCSPPFCVGASYKAWVADPCARHVNSQWACTAPRRSTRASP